MKARLLVVTMLLSLSLLQLSFAEEGGPPPGEEFFKPVTMLGSNFSGRMQAESNVIINATMWRTAPGAYNSNFYASTEFAHQTMEASENGGCGAAVRYFADASFNSSFGNVESTQTTALKGRKAYAKNQHPTVARPGKFSPIDLAMMDFDIDDPFRALLPQKSLKKDLTWEPAGDVIKYLLRKGNNIRSASRGEEKRIKDEEEGKKNGDDKKKSPDGVMQERGGGGGWDRDWTPPEIQYSLDFDITKTYAIIEKFKLDGFSARVEFSGTLNVPLTMEKTDIPFTGVITFEYDTVLKALKQGDLEVSASWEGKIKIWRNEVPVKVDLKEKYSFFRENRPVYELAKGLQADSRTFGSASPEAPVLVSSVKDGLVLLANWDGTGAYEVLNGGNPVKGEQSLPTAGAVSSDGTSIVLALTDKLLTSTDAGRTFKPMPWKYPVKGISFLNSPKQIAIIATDDGEFHRLECTPKKVAAKKLTGPVAGKKILVACPGSEEDGMFVAIADGFYFCTEGSKFRKISNIGEAPICMTTFGNGVVVLSTVLQFISSDDGKDITALNIPQNVVFIDTTDKSIFMLTAAGEMFSVPIEGGEVTMCDKDVRNFTCGFNKLFIAKENGITIK